MGENMLYRRIMKMKYLQDIYKYLSLFLPKSVHFPVFES